MTVREGISPLSWGAALVRGAAVIVLAFACLVYVPNLILTGLSGLSRAVREAIAITWFFGILFVLAMALRALQKRRVL